MIANRVFRPFETLIDPLNLPINHLPDKGPLKLVWHFASMFRNVLLAVTLLSSVAAAISLAAVWMLAFIVDGVTANGAELFIHNHLAVLIGFAFLWLVVNPLICFIDECYMSQTVQTLLPAAMRWQSHKAVENQDIAFFEDLYAGQVASKIEQVTRSVQTQLLLAVERLPNFFIDFAGSLLLLFVLAWQLAIPVIIWIVLNILVAIYVTPRLIDKSAKVAEASARATGAMTDVYSNISIVKAFSAEAAEGDTIREVMQDTIETRHREQRIQILTFTAVHLLNALLAVSVFTLSLWGMLDDFVSLGEFVAAATIVTRLTSVSFIFIGMGFQISESYGTVRDAMPVITATPTLRDKSNATPFVLDEGGIALENVSYSYLNEGVLEQADSNSNQTELNEEAKSKDKTSDDTDAESVDTNQATTPAKAVIENLNLTVFPGEKVGLVGLSGAGKSTIISLLLRLRDVDGGSVRFDGQDVRDVQQKSLRQQIGVISQDVFLMNRSVRENVRYGASSATDNQIRHALQLANALEFVDDMCDKQGRAGLDAYVGDRGVKLSGGQRQRLAIARVILKDPRILFLDEATSALDSESETEIQQNLQQLMSDKTAIVIAHRLSTLSAMDRLVVLDKGRIAEQGTHNELIGRDGLYARLWHRQSGGFIATV